MREWAVELQRFFVSRARSRDALQLAVERCDDPIIKAYLPYLPPKSSEAFNRGKHLVSDLVTRGLNAEAAVLQFVVFVPMLEEVDNAQKLTREQRDNLVRIIDELVETCLEAALRPSLAVISVHRGDFYRTAGDLAVARDSYEVARSIMRGLAKVEPETYQVHLALTLSRLGFLCEDTSDFAAARKSFEEALDILRKLAEIECETYQFRLAVILTRLGRLCRLSTDFPAARDAYEDALEIWRKLAEAEPQTHKQDLAMILHFLGYLHRDTRDFAAARDAFVEALTIRRGLAKADPQTHLDDLAATLNGLGSIYSDTRNFLAARKAYEEARDLCSKLAESDSRTYQNRLAMTANNLAILYRDTRDFAAASEAYEKARDLFSELAKADPQTYLIDLGGALLGLGAIYADTYDFDAALVALEEAREIYSELMKSDPPTYQHRLAMTLHSLGTVYSETEDLAAARKALEKSLDLMRRLANSDPSTYQHDLAMTLNSLGLLYEDCREFTVARGALEEAREIWSKLAKSDPQTYRHDLTGILNNLGIFYDKTKDFAAARDMFEKCLAQAEAVVSEHQRHLSKGSARTSYRFLLGEVVDQPNAAFAYAAAMRDGPSRSSILDRKDLLATQSLLDCIKRQTGREMAILVPTSGHEATLTLGMITASICDWWRLPSMNWIEHFFKDPRIADRAAQHQLARRIWCDLPEALQNVLAPACPAAFEILISGDPRWSAFPWELLRFGEGDDDYLGLHMALSRIGSILAPALERTFAAKGLGRGRRVAIVAPHTVGPKPLLGVEIEVELLENRIPQLGGELVERKTTGSDAHSGLMRRAIEAAPDILWYSGHGAIISNEEVLVLHSETPRGNRPQDKLSYFGGHQLSEIATEKNLEALFGHAPLVVLNSCLTGRTREHGGLREDMVEGFLRHGAGAAIATALPIFDSVGEALGQAMFSEAAIAKPTIGESVVEVRRQLAAGLCSNIDQPTWGAWAMVHLHGNPLAAGPFYSPGGN